MSGRHVTNGRQVLSVIVIVVLAMIAVPPVLANPNGSADTDTESVSEPDLRTSQGYGPSKFAVTVDSKNTPASEDESLGLTATVDNTGDQVNTQTVTLSVGGAVLQVGETDTASATQASIVFDDQAVADSSRQEVVVRSVTLTEGGFVAVYNTTAGGDLDSVIGVSGYLEGEQEHTNVRVDLDRAIANSQTLAAVVHKDTNGNNMFEFDGGDIDERLTQQGAVVSDSATVRRRTPTPTATPTPTPTPTPFSTATATPTPTVTPTPFPQSNLDCLTAEESEVRAQLDSLATQTMAALPTEVQSRAAGERIEIAIGDPNPIYFGAVIDEHSTVQSVQSGRLDGPTITAEADCQTIDRITSAENSSDALRQSISRDEITWKGTTPGRDALLGYGTKGIQMDYIRSSGKVGNALDVLDGFVNGVLMR